MNNIKTLQSYIDGCAINEEQAAFIIALLDQSFRLSYRTRMDFMLSADDQRQIDSATPEPLNNILALTLPRDQFPQLAFDYRDDKKIHGGYLNLDRLFLQKMYELFN